jgi:beta-lactamase regulating signal transducer with metallopeptidase domain
MIDAFLRALESIFAWLIEVSWQASVLVALVLLLHLTLRNRLNPRWRHALWLLVIARLLLPFLPESTLSLFQFAPSPPPVVVETVTAPIFQAAPELTVEMPSVPPSPVAYPFSAFTLLALSWLVGVLALLVVTLQVNRRFARHVMAAPPVTDPRLLQLAEAAQCELGLHRRLRLIESAQVQSPAIMGLFRPTLILPQDVLTRFDDQELRFIFLHEFAHLKRGDLFLQWLVALLQILHWFNPVLWYAFRRMRSDREPATDALVLSCTGEASKEPYGQVLVKLLEHYHQRHSLPTLVGILEDKDQFKRRFSLIARFTRGAYGWSMLGVLLIGVLSIACLTKSKAAANATASPSPAATEISKQIIDAVKKDDAASLAKRVDGIDVGKILDGDKPLLIMTHNLEIAKILLEHGADPNARWGDNGDVPLFLARKRRPGLRLLAGSKRVRGALTRWRSI